VKTGKSFLSSGAVIMRWYILDQLRIHWLLSQEV